MIAEAVDLPTKWARDLIAKFEEIHQGITLSNIARASISKLTSSRLDRDDRNNQINRLASKRQTTADRFLSLIRNDVKNDMARYIKEARSQKEVRNIFLLRAKASSLLAEQATRHLVPSPDCP